jgi:hypothetical protein
MTANDWMALVVSIVTIVGSFIASVRWLVKHYLSELKPDGNGGHNLEGRVARIETKIDTLYQTLISSK